MKLGFMFIKKLSQKILFKKLNNIKNVKIIFKKGDLTKEKPMCWRFEPILNDDVELMLCRDTDTRIFPREVEAVNEWLGTDSLIHIMRDHKYYHWAKIFGGMFGVKKSKHIQKWKKILENINQNQRERNYDLDVLNEILKLYQDKDIFVHSSGKIFPNEKVFPFPTPYDKDYNFVGCYIDENGIRKEEHHEMLKQ